MARHHGRIRVLLAGFMLGLLVSGVTVFPLAQEVTAIASGLGAKPGVPASEYSGLLAWLVTVRDGLTATEARFPFLFYGYDWLAFAHLVIAALFVGPFMDPVRNVWVIRWGVFACVAILPLAFICGTMRGIPFFWQLIDCSFGVVGIVPLLVCLRSVREIERLS